MATAGNHSNQVTVMQIMGLVGEDAAVSEGQEHACHAPPFPVDDEQLKLLQTVMHDLHPCYQLRGTCDGYLYLRSIGHEHEHQWK